MDSELHREGCREGREFDYRFGHTLAPGSRRGRVENGEGQAAEVRGIEGNEPRNTGGKNGAIEDQPVES